MRICCCTWSMPAIRCATSASSRCARCCAGIGAGEIRELLVFNKIDLVARRSPAGRPRRGRHRRRRCGSRRSPGEGLPALREAIAQAVRPNQVRRTLHLELPAAAVRSDLYRRNAVRAERQCDDGSWELDVELDLTEIAKLLGSKGVNLVETRRNGPRNSAWHSSLVSGRVGC